MTQRLFTFGLAAWSGAGKTTLAEKIIKQSVIHNISISTVKHAHHNFEADIEGKDSFRHRKAGAGQVVIASANRMAKFTEKKTPFQPTLAYCLAELDSCDWVLVEGFKSEAICKIEVFNPALGHPPLYEIDDNIKAIVVPELGADYPIAAFQRDDIAGIFAFLCQLADDQHSDNQHSDNQHSDDQHSDDQHSDEVSL
ncbi:MAG: molybdopterin-guanine dinucleotide biosynthesis protein B [Candidatus Puniceispirillaceae bacterium]